MKRNAVENALESLVLAKKELQNQLSSIDLAIKALGGYDNDEEADNQSQESRREPTTAPEKSIRHVIQSKKGYNKHASYSDKFLYAIRESNRFLHPREIAEFVISREKGDFKQVLDKLTDNTYQIRKKGIVAKFKASTLTNDTFWGLPEWLGEDGNIKEGHEYNPEYVYKRKNAPQEVHS